jgi:hypothetical protein
MSAATIAEARRSNEVERLTKAIVSLERDIAEGVNDANGMLSAYKAERREWLTYERDRLREVIAELGALSPEALVAKYVPEARPVEAVPLRDTLKRGDYSPGVQVVVHTDPPITRRTGGNPAPVHPTQAPPGVTYTYDAGGNLVAM